MFLQNIKISLDEGSGQHPADYEFSAFVSDSELAGFPEDDRARITAASTRKPGGYIVPLEKFSGEPFDRLLQYKIYDFLPWETEKPVMLDKWREFAESVSPDEIYVFNCVLLQNSMCETMMRFGFDQSVSAGYIGGICGIIKPLEPFVVYLKNKNIRADIEKTIPERGTDWLNGVIDYHCNGGYGREHHLSGFDGYIAALEERQKRELEILRSLSIQHTVMEDPGRDWNKTYAQMMRSLEGAEESR